LNFEIRGDSANYEVLEESAKLIRGVPGITLEIGVREGFGSYTIMNTLLTVGDKRPHIGIDPYGNIEYAPDETRTLRADYTNEMRGRAVALSVYASNVGYLYYPLALEDTEYFKAFGEGYPVYEYTKRIERDYALVHFDGPHTRAAVTREINFFDWRTPVGGIWVFDDVADYDHPHDFILRCGFERIIETPKKWAYRRIR
jgi:hypothetical protein